MFVTNPNTGITRDEDGNLYPLHSYYYIPEFNKVVYCHEVKGDKLLLGGMCDFVNDSFTTIIRQVISLKDFFGYQPIHLSYSQKQLNYVGEYPFMYMHDFKMWDDKTQRVNDRLGVRIADSWKSILPKATSGGFPPIVYLKGGDRLRIKWKNRSYDYIVTIDNKLVNLSAKCGEYFAGNSTLHTFEDIQNAWGYPQDPILTIEKI